MKKGRINFKGHFVEFFLKSFGLLVLSVITFGILFPYYVYWSAKYFFSRMEIEIDE